MERRVFLIERNVSRVMLTMALLDFSTVGHCQSRYVPAYGRLYCMLVVGTGKGLHPHEMIHGKSR